jgi:hypothetical protein
MTESEGNSGIRIVTTNKSDKEIAEDLRNRMKEALGPVFAIFDEAANHGMLISWDSFGPQAPYNRTGVNGLRVTKTLAN